MMNVSKDIKHGFDFVSVKDFITYEKAMEVNEHFEKNFEMFEPKQFGAKNNDGSEKKNATVKQIRWKNIKDILGNDVQRLLSFIRYSFGYNVYDLHDDETLNINIYNADSKQSYDWHTDESKNPMYDIKVTALFNVSKREYNGGEFEIFKSDVMPVINLKDTGGMVMFKSHLNHRVLPVLSGERRTVAIFFKGPKFQ